MAHLTVVLSWTGERLLISEIELDNLTDIQLVNECISKEHIPDLQDAEYMIYDSINMCPVRSNGMSLSKLGYSDGDVIVIIVSPVPKKRELYLQTEFNLIRKFQQNPVIKKYMDIYYRINIDNQIIWQSVENDSFVTEPEAIYPTQYKVTYKMPMYVDKDVLINDWSASLIFNINESYSKRRYTIEIEGGEFSANNTPFNNYISRYWVSPVFMINPISDIFKEEPEHNLWYYIMLTGCLLNQDSIATPNDSEEENRHLNSEAFRYWKYDRQEKPISEIDWPYNFGEITLKLGPTGETIPLSDVDLDHITNIELISQLTSAGIIDKAPECTSGWRILDKNNQLVFDSFTIAELGFVYGDEIRLVIKACGS